MSSEPSQLKQAFLDDHRHLMRGLKRIVDALKRGDDRAAVEAADRVDQAVGPHMRFEEEEFYPTLRRVLGDAYVDRLYDEHSDGQHAVRELCRHGAVPLDEDDRRRLGRQVEATLEHAVSCGTLLSHLDALGESERQKLLDRLLALRAEGQRWSEYGLDR